MKTRGVMEENLQDYKKIGMFISSPSCSWKCLVEQNLPMSICQNNHLTNNNIVEYSNEELLDIYKNNLLTECIIIGGLEPIDNFEEIYNFIKVFREKSNDDVVMYTGYYPEEIEDKIETLKAFPNIIVKFGRYKHETKSRFDEVLGVTLISDNQFAVKIS